MERIETFHSATPLQYPTLDTMWYNFHFILTPVQPGATLVSNAEHQEKDQLVSVFKMYVMTQLGIEPATSRSKGRSTDQSHTMEPACNRSPQKQPPSYSSHISYFCFKSSTFGNLESGCCRKEAVVDSFIVCLTSPWQPTLYNRQFYVFQRMTVIERLHHSYMGEGATMRIRLQTHPDSKGPDQPAHPRSLITIKILKHWDR